MEPTLKQRADEPLEPHRPSRATTQPRAPRRRWCWPRRAPAIALVLALAGWMACDTDDGEPSLTIDEGGATEPDAAEPPAPTPYVDILFVIDDSASMAEEQALLARALPDFLAGLYVAAESGGARPDLHVGVASTDMGTGGFMVSTCTNPEGGDGGCLRSTPSPAVADCDSSYPPFLSRTRADDATYPVGELAGDFACVATLGTAGCGFEQPFSSARRALLDNTGPGGCNDGFLRPGSVVAAIFVSDEDDCTVSSDHPELFDPARDDLGHLNIRCALHPELVSSVEEQVAALQALVGAGHTLVVGALVGVPSGVTACNGFGNALAGCLDEPAMREQIDPASPTELVPSCASVLGRAYPPRRFVQLAQRIGALGYVASICQSDYKDALVQLAGRIIQSL